jgi:hypothetical protein
VSALPTTLQAVREAFTREGLRPVDAETLGVFAVTRFGVDSTPSHALSHYPFSSTDCSSSAASISLTKHIEGHQNIYSPRLSTVTILTPSTTTFYGPSGQRKAGRPQLPVSIKAAVVRIAEGGRIEAKWLGTTLTAATLGPVLEVSLDAEASLQLHHFVKVNSGKKKCSMPIFKCAQSSSLV